MSFLINSYRYVAAAFSDCSSSGTGTTYINNSPRTAIITQIGTAGTFEWLDESSDNISFWLKATASNSGNIYAYQLNSGGIIGTSTDYVDSASLGGSYTKYTFNFSSDFTLSAATGIGVIRFSGSGNFNIGQWLASQGGNLSDCVINQGWDDGAEGAGNLNMCVGE